MPDADTLDIDPMSAVWDKQPNWPPPFPSTREEGHPILFRNRNIEHHRAESLCIDTIHTVSIQRPRST